MELRIGDSTYKQTRKIDAFTQMALLSKVSPLLASGFGELAPLLVQMKREGIAKVSEISLTQLGAIATPVSRELAKMTDEDRRYIIGSCLSTVERQRDGERGYFPIWTPEIGRAMYDDINNDFLLMLRIALGVFQETFQSFLPIGLFNSTGSSSAAASHSIQ